jgi:tetratricopeptide (TPR) repeat protein
MGLGLVCLAELVLWFADYGGPTEMFVRLPNGDGTSSWVTNPNAFRAGFAQHPLVRWRGAHPGIPAQRFPVRKSPDTFRICVFGASTANGYPHRINGSFALFLESILNTVQSRKRVEVFIAGCAALSSFSLLGRIDELTDYGADMVVIYCGHNEFYGLYGPGTTMPLSTRRPVTRLQIWLRERRLTIALGDLLARFATPPPEVEQGDVLATAFPDRTDIRYGDETYVAVRANYEANLEAMVTRATRNGLAVVLCTPAANLGGFPVLGSMHDAGTGQEALSRWEEACAAAEEAASAGDYGRAAALWRQASAASPGHGETRLRLAQALRALGEDEEAYTEFRAAADRDTVRWRAGSDFADAVRRVAERHRDDGVLLADCEAYLRQHAPNGIPGGGMFMEHVHPTLEGNFRLGESVARALAGSGQGSAFAPWRWDRHGDLYYYERLNDIDTYQRIASLQSMIEFRRSVLGLGDTPEDKQMSNALDALRASLTPEEIAAARTADATPGVGAAYDWLRVCLAREYASRGRWTDALREMRKVLRYGNCQKYNRAYARALEIEAEILVQAGRIDLAAPLVSRAQAIRAAEPKAPARDLETAEEDAESE